MKLEAEEKNTEIRDWGMLLEVWVDKYQSVKISA